MLRYSKDRSLTNATWSLRCQTYPLVVAATEASFYQNINVFSIQRRVIQCDVQQQSIIMDQEQHRRLVNQCAVATERLIRMKRYLESGEHKLNQLQVSLGC